MQALIRLPQPRFRHGQDQHARRQRPRALAAAGALVALVAFLTTGCGRTSMIGSGASGGTSPGGSTATGNGTATTSGPISLTVQHQTGTQALTITLTVTNASQQTMTWNGGCVTPYTVLLRDAQNNLVQRWPPIQTGARCNAIVVVKLQPGMSQTFSIVQTTNLRASGGGAISAGTYTVNAHFIVDKYNGAGPLNFVANQQINW